MSKPTSTKTKYKISNFTTNSTEITYVNAFFMKLGTNVNRSASIIDQKRFSIVLFVKICLRIEIEMLTKYSSNTECSDVSFLTQNANIFILLLYYCDLTITFILLFRLHIVLRENNSKSRNNSLIIEVI